MHALLPGVLAFGLLLWLLYTLIKDKKKDQEGGPGGGTVPSRYNLRMRPTKPGVDLSIYKRY